MAETPMTPEQLLLVGDPEYILLKRYGNSLKKLSERYPEGCPEHVRAQAFGLTEEQLKEEDRRIIACLADRMGVSSGNE
jgi:hypothetical protein